MAEKKVRPILHCELRDMEGKLHRVSDHRGRWLVINFWATCASLASRKYPIWKNFPGK